MAIRLTESRLRQIVRETIQTDIKAAYTDGYNWGESGEREPPEAYYRSRGWETGALHDAWIEGFMHGEQYENMRIKNRENADYSY